MDLAHLDLILLRFEVPSHRSGRVCVELNFNHSTIDPLHVLHFAGIVVFVHSPSEARALRLIFRIDLSFYFSS